MPRSARLPVAGLATVAALLLAGCGSGSSSPASSPAAGAPVIGGIGGGIGGAPVPAAAGSCSVVGRYSLAAITAKGSAPTALGRLQVTGGQGIRVEFVADGTWSLTDDGSQPVTVVTDGHRAEGRLAGRIAGRYVADGTGYRFEQTSADGDIRITSTLGSATLPMSALGPALVPTGSVTATCGDPAGGLTLDSPNVSLTLAPAG